METLARRLVWHRLLGVAWNGVILGVGADDRAARAPGGEKGGRHLAAALFDVEPFVTQQVDIGFGGTVFPPRRFGISPDLQIEVGEPLPVLVDPIVRKPLRLREARHSFNSFRAERRLVETGLRFYPTRVMGDGWQVISSQLVAISRWLILFSPSGRLAVWPSPGTYRHADPTHLHCRQDSQWTTQVGRATGSR